MLVDGEKFYPWVFHELKAFWLTKSLTPFKKLPSFWSLCHLSLQLTLMVALELHRMINKYYLE